MHNFQGGVNNRQKTKENLLLNYDKEKTILEEGKKCAPHTSSIVFFSLFIEIIIFSRLTTKSDRLQQQQNYPNFSLPHRGLEMVLLYP